MFSSRHQLLNSPCPSPPTFRYCRCRKWKQLLTFTFILWLPDRHGCARIPLSSKQCVMQYMVSWGIVKLSPQFLNHLFVPKMYVGYLPQKLTFWSISEYFFLFIYQLYICLSKGVKLCKSMFFSVYLTLGTSVLCAGNSWDICLCVPKWTGVVTYRATIPLSV